MNVMETLTPAERARQLANPEGEVGLAVAEWLNGNNRKGYERVLADMSLAPGARVLEIGPGNGRLASEIVAAAPDVQYAGIDISPTMVDEANRHNAELVAAGRAAFHLGDAETMSFADGSFDRVFAIGVIHFWRDPARPLAQIRRVLRGGGMALLRCLSPHSANETFSPEHGFFLRGAGEWDQLCRAAGFAGVRALEPSTTVPGPDGEPVTRYSIEVNAWA
jgi:ubiquinone/menaquinone biosynthesis C-methylase UbiE